VSNSQNDDDLLSDDFAPHVSALSARDVMTPHVRDIIAAETGK
jgi:hypothetical protein